MMLLVFSIASDARSLYTFPMMLPLAVLAIAGLDELPRRFIPWLNRIALILIGVTVLVLWLGWIAMYNGIPTLFADKLRSMQPAYLPSMNPLLFSVACIYTIAWLCIAVFAGRKLLSPLLRWSSGVVLVWGLLMTLWLPWFNAGSSYRSVFLSLAEAVPDWNHCIASKGFGESERAMAEYYAGIITARLETRPDAVSDLFLVQGNSTSLVSPGKQWVKIWEGGRPGKVKERFALWQRVGRQ